METPEDNNQKLLSTSLPKRWKLIHKQKFENYENFGFRVRAAIFQAHDNQMVDSEDDEATCKNGNLQVALEIIDEKSHILLDFVRIDLSLGSETLNFTSVGQLKSSETCVNLKYLKLLDSNHVLFISDKQLSNTNLKKEINYSFEQNGDKITVKFIKLAEKIKNLPVSNQENLKQVNYDPAKNQISAGEIQGKLFDEVKNVKIDVNADPPVFTAEKVQAELNWPTFLLKDHDASETSAEKVQSFNQDQTEFKSPRDIGGQFENCDYEAANLNSALVCYNFVTHQMVFSSNISGQNYLFDGPQQINDQSALQSLVLQSDVDGFIYEINHDSDFKDMLAKHIATLNAMSYVINGKPNLQFKMVSPNFETCVLVDRRIRAYVYHMNANPHTNNSQDQVLRNRKMNKNVNEISTQQLVTLPQDLAKEDIVGMKVENDRFYVLTTSSLLIFKV